MVIPSFGTAYFQLVKAPLKKLGKGKGKGKVYPRTGHENPEGGRSIALLFPYIGPSWGGWSTSRPGRFTPGTDPVPTV